MKVPAQDARDLEIARLRGGLGDLMGLLALSAAWNGREAPEIIRTLGEALSTVLRLDQVFVALEGEPDGTFAAPGWDAASGPATAGAEWRRLLGADPRNWPSAATGELFGKQVSIATLPLGLRSGFGVVAAAAERADFPSDTERLLLGVARNQALLALQEARLRRDERLQASELSALSLIEGIPGFVAMLGPDGQVERVNRQIEEYCGQPIEELRNWGSNGIVHPDDLPHVAEVFGGSIATGTPYVIEQRLRRFDGEYRWFDNRGRPMRDANGAIVAWHVLLTDIDDRRRAEEAVRASERRLRQQVETFPQMLWSATAEGNIDYCNERLLAYSGLAAQEVMNGGWVNLLHPDDREPTARIWSHCVATGEPYSVEVRHFNSAAGSHRWNLTTALPLRDGDGRILKWFGACVDIHDLKLSEEALRASERHLAQIIDTIPAYVFSAGPDGSVNYLNPQLRDWFGRDEERILASEWVHLTHPEDREGTVEAWFGAVAAGRSYRREVRFLHRSGEYRWCDNLASPLRDGDGTIVAWHGVVNDIHDRKLAEDALKASEENLRLTIDTIPALAWSARADGTADFFNRHYLDYVGFALEDLRDWQWLRVIHPDDLSIVTGAWEQFDRERTGGDVEARLRRHDGTYRWFSFRSHPLRDAQGNIVKWYGVKVDVDDQKRATLMLAGERRLLELIASGRPLLEILSALCAVVEGALADCVCQVRTLDGSGTVFEHAVAPSLPSGVASSQPGTPLSPESSPWDLAVSRKRQLIVADIEDHPDWAGTKFHELLRDHGLRSAWFVPIAARDGSVLGCLGIFQRHSRELQPRDKDIIDRAVQIASIAIERWRAEDELKRREYLLRTAEQISETGWFNWDLNNNKLVWSPQMYRIWELDESIEPKSVNLLPMVHPDDRARVEERVAKVFRGEDIPQTEERYVMPDGRIKYISGTTLIFRYEDGRRECVGVAQDITRRKVAEEGLDKVRSELAHVTRVASLGELTASIAHEVSQPLAGIITNASTCIRMLSTDPPDIEGAIKTAQRGLRDGNRASQVIQRLRGLFRKQNFAAEPLDLNEAIEEVIAICTHDLQRRRIASQAALDRELRSVMGDRIQLQQVILNLVLNAADAVDAGTTGSRQITVETRQVTADMVQVAVRDTGSGIAAENLEKIFDAFFTTKSNGMGIGLSVSSSIVERHGGKLWASANDGPGSTFAFSIPCAPDAGHGLPSEPGQVR